MFTVCWAVAKYVGTMVFFSPHNSPNDSDLVTLQLRLRKDSLPKSGLVSGGALNRLPGLLGPVCLAH